MTYLEVFVYLQLLDFMTTVVGLRMGGRELSPLIAWTMGASSPVAALTITKGIGFVLGGVCLQTGRMRVIQWVNYIFAAVVTWNLFNILKAVAR